MAREQVLVTGSLIRGAASVGAVSVKLPVTATSSVPPLERTSSVEPAGTGSGPPPRTRRVGT